MKSEQKAEPKYTEPTLAKQGKVGVVFGDLSPGKNEGISKILGQFGGNLPEIAKKLKVKYQTEKLRIKGKGFFHKFASSQKAIIAKRDDQIYDLGIIFHKLQKDPLLNEHEKAILLYGALQVTIDNIARTEANSPYKSGLSQMCHKLQDELTGEKIGIQAPDPSQAKILYNIYKSAEKQPVEKFREAAETGVAMKPKMAQK